MSKYIYLHRPDHPEASRNTGNVLAHRIVMEKHIGRYLRPEEVVHHINGITDDNQIKNLELFSSDSLHHASRHNTLKHDGAVLGDKISWQPRKKSCVRTLPEARRGQKRAGSIRCLACGKRFVPKRKKQKFHCSNCRKRTWDEKKIIETAIKALQFFHQNKFGMKGEA